MKILAIETSCDETALSLLEAAGENESLVFSPISTALYSQVEKHREFGGVFPALAKREHALNLVPLLDQVLPPTDIPQRDPRKSGDDGDEEINWNEVEKILERETELFAKLKNFVETHEKPMIDMIAVTSGPGLEPALWVGINFARALSLIWNIPVLPVNHMEGHIASVLLSQNLSKSEISNPKSQINSTNYKLQTTNSLVDFPAIALLISGGHTEIILVKNWGEYEKIGNTLDDAVGEAYDKVARMIGLPYPGGPEISKLADEARRDPHLREDDSITLPRPMIGSGDLNFSLSGLKTAVLYKVKKLEESGSGELTETQKKIIAKEFEQAVVDVLIKKTKKAIEEKIVSTLIVGGGVIANEYIRESLEKLGKEENVKVFFPTREHSTDNAVMIAVAGYLKSFREKPEICPDIKANGNLSL